MPRTPNPCRVAVTGLSLLTPVGNDLATSWDALVTGKSGVSQVTKFDPTGHKTSIAGEIKNFQPELYMDKKGVKRFDLVIQYAVAVGKMAMAHSGLVMNPELAPQAGCVMGCGLGGLMSIVDSHITLLEKGPDRVSPFFIPVMIPNMAAGQIAIELGLKGPNLMVCTACAAGTHAIGWAFQQIRDNGQQVMLAGGSEAVVTPLSFAGFNALKALSTRNDDPTLASRPFDRDRDGFVIGEGAGMLVLENWDHAVNRGATIYAEIVGFGASGDAYHMTAPPETGEGAMAAMREALVDAQAQGLALEDITYINAHGTSTGLNDAIETRAVKEVFGAHAHKLAMSSTKSMIGHLLGAAGGVEAVISVMAIKEGILPPTINLENPDPQCDLDYIPKVARKASPQAVMSNSFGFGGTNGSLIFKAV